MDKELPTGFGMELPNGVALPRRTSSGVSRRFPAFPGAAPARPRRSKIRNCRQKHNSRRFPEAVSRRFPESRF